jgi:hypothetical protein
MRFGTRAMPSQCHAKREGGELSRDRWWSLPWFFAQNTSQNVARMERSGIRDNRCRFDVAPGLHFVPSGLRKKKIGSRTPTEAKSSSAVPERARPRLEREAHIYRRSTAVLAPRSVSSQGAQPQARLPGTWRPVVCSLSGFPRPCLSLSPARTAHPSRSARGLMPKAARVQVASPPAGTALAPRPGTACQATSVWARFEHVCN